MADETRHLFSILETRECLGSGACRTEVRWYIPGRRPFLREP